MYVECDRRKSSGNRFGRQITLEQTPPIFLIHGSGENVLLYQSLAQYLGIDRPLFGLQSRGLVNNKISHSLIDQMAQHNIEQI